MTTTTTIKPGILVALRSSVEGGVRYERRDLQNELVDGGLQVAKWETTKVVEDAAEHDRASKVRGAALKLISAVCVRTSFGLLAPLAKEQELNAAHEEARALVTAFNAEARTCRVNIYLLKGRIAESDEEAVRAIGAEVRSLIDEMSRGIDNLDVEAVRSAASKALEMGAVLGEEQQAKVTAAVQAARNAARAIVKRVQKGGEAAQTVLAAISRADIEKARIAFLDLDDTALAAPGAELPAVDLARAAALDLDGANDVQADAPAAPEPSPEPPPASGPRAALAPAAVPALDFGDDEAPAAPAAAPAAAPRAMEFGDAL